MKLFQLIVAQMKKRDNLEFEIFEKLKKYVSEADKHSDF